MLSIWYSRRITEDEYLNKKEFFKHFGIFTFRKTRAKGGYTNKPPVFTREYRFYIGEHPSCS